MNHNLLKILSHSNKDIDNQKLMDYLAGQLSAKEIHEVETSMADSDFVRDAIEGLQEVNGNTKIENLVEQLNKDLHLKLQQKKIRKQKRKLIQQPWIYFTIVLILLLITITWFVIHFFTHMHK